MNATVGVGLMTGVGLTPNFSRAMWFAQGSGAIKRKWNDDVVFRNQARDVSERDSKRFINDTIRNDFHKRFLSKYVQ